MGQAGPGHRGSEWLWASRQFLNVSSTGVYFLIPFITMYIITSCRRLIADSVSRPAPFIAPPSHRLGGMGRPRVFLYARMCARHSAFLLPLLLPHIASTTTSQPISRNNVPHPSHRHPHFGPPRRRESSPSPSPPPSAPPPASDRPRRARWPALTGQTSSGLSSFLRYISYLGPSADALPLTLLAHYPARPRTYPSPLRSLCDRRRRCPSLPFTSGPDVILFPQRSARHGPLLHRRPRRGCHCLVQGL